MCSENGTSYRVSGHDFRRAVMVKAGVTRRLGRGGALRRGLCSPGESEQPSFAVVKDGLLTNSKKGG
jgi:hypothetical protein